jgi:two-component sensor histidine kinase
VRLLALPLPRPRILLAAIAAITVVAGVIGLALSTWFDHDATIADWTMDLSTSARLVESHVRGAHGLAQASLARIEDRLADRRLDQIRESAKDRDWLDGLVAEIPQAVAVRLYDPTGRLVLDTDRQSESRGRLDRHADLSTAMGQPGRTVIGAYNLAGAGAIGHHVCFLRTLVDNSGMVKGVAELVVASVHFSDYFRSLAPTDTGSLANVVRRDGLTIVRQPAGDGPLLRFDITQHPFTIFAKSAEGSYQSKSIVDGTDRLYTYRVLPDLDVVVVAALSMEMVLRDWRVRTQRNTALFTAFVAMLLALSVVTNESLGQEGRLLRSVQAKADELAAALEEKDVLFQEVHHRVKNNLQVISSLLTMQSLHVGDETARATLKDALDRIHSMGLVHQTLYERNLAANVDLGVYFGRLAEALVGSYGSGKGAVTVQVEVEGTLELDRAVPLGMLANEALSNALKHAFPEGRGGTVTISLKKGATEWHFAVRDDGVGMPAKPSKGIGLSLIRALTRQLNGKSAISREDGTSVVVTFPV